MSTARRARERERERGRLTGGRLGLAGRLLLLVVLLEAGNEVGLVAGMGEAALAQELLELRDLHGAVVGHDGDGGAGVAAHPRRCEMKRRCESRRARVRRRNDCAGDPERLPDAMRRVLLLVVVNVERWNGCSCCGRKAGKVAQETQETRRCVLGPLGRPQQKAGLAWLCDWWIGYR